jgi:hypothetical protein
VTKKARTFVLFFLLVGGGTAGAAERGHWLRDHFSGEWVIGAAAWRTAIGVDTNAPGFDVAAGGGDLYLGLEVGSGFAVIASGRVLAGRGYVEGQGGLGLQLRLSDRVRLRAGPAAGQVSFDGDQKVLAGGFLAGSVDLIPFGGGRVAATIGLRFDVDGLIGDSRKLPSASIGLALGVGLRY